MIFIIYQTILGIKACVENSMAHGFEVEGSNPVYL